MSVKLQALLFTIFQFIFIFIQLKLPLNHTYLQVNTVLSSGCEKLDQILGGGFKTKAITEISGLPGTGKTQIW
jgi:predicted ATP-dependent serine protease